MDRELKKTIAQLNMDGYSTVRHPDDEEEPDKWFVFAVWKSYGERNLWLDYEWQIGKYHFYVWNARKQVKLTKRAYDRFRVNDYIQEEFGNFLPKARKVAKALMTKGLFLTKDLDFINFVEEDRDTFVSLVSWFTDGKYDEYLAGLKADGDKPYFIMAEANVALKKLKRMGYKTVLTYDQEGNKSVECLLDADFCCLNFYWDEWEDEIKEYILDEVNSELNGSACDIFYDEKRKSWLCELNLELTNNDKINDFIHTWNKKKPYNIKCSRDTENETNILVFKNGFKYG